MAEPLIDRLLRRQKWMDGIAEVLQGAVGRVYGALRPAWPGHQGSPRRHPSVPMRPVALSDLIGRATPDPGRRWRDRRAGALVLALGFVG